MKLLSARLRNLDFFSISDWEPGMVVIIIFLFYQETGPPRSDGSSSHQPQGQPETNSGKLDRCLFKNISSKSPSISFPQRDLVFANRQLTAGGG